LGNLNLTTGQTQPVTEQPFRPAAPNYRESGLVRWHEAEALAPTIVVGCCSFS